MFMYIFIYNQTITNKERKMSECKNCGSEYCEDQLYMEVDKTGRCHDCTSPEEFDEIYKKLQDSK